MALFDLRQDQPPQRSFTIGETLNIELTREFHLSALFIKLRFTIAALAPMATANADGILAILNRVRLQVASGASTRNVVDCSGAGLIEYAQQIAGHIDRQTQAFILANPAAATAVTIVYPIFFEHPQLQDPLGSALMLPLPAFSSNPVLTLQIATQAQMDLNGAPTFAFTGGTVDLIKVSRYVANPEFPIFETELAETSQFFAASGSALRTELQTPGSFLGILIRDFQSNVLRGDIGAGGFDGTGFNTLELLGTNFRRWRNADLQVINDFSNGNRVGATEFLGSFYLDFITDKTGEGGQDLGSVLDANLTVGSGAKITLLQDILGGATVQRNLLTHRIFGNLSALKRG